MNESNPTGKGRAIIWDNVPGQGINLRHGPIRNSFETDRLNRDKKYLETNSYELVKSEIIEENSTHWNENVPHDTIFFPDGRPRNPQQYN